MLLKDFAKRTAASAIAIGTVGCLVVLADLSWFRFVVAIVVAALSGIAIWEYGQFVKAKGGRVALPALILVGMAQVLSFVFPSVRFSSSWEMPLLIFFVGFLTLIALHFKENQGAVADLAVSSFGLLYIAVPMGMILGILYGGAGGGQDGRGWAAYLLAVTKLADIGAYVGGSLLGRRKLAPAISPGKTVEGAVVGLVCSITASFVFYLISNASQAASFRLGFLESILLGALLGCVGQFGDLTESLLKRDANKKDSNDLPGLGGVLDMIDSLLFNAFIIFFYLRYHS